MGDILVGGRKTREREIWEGDSEGIYLMYSDNRKQAHEALGLLAGHTDLLSVSLFAVACPPLALG